MRILQICQKLPFPPIDGGAQATYFTTLGLLANGASVKVLAVNPSRITIPQDSANCHNYKPIIQQTVNVDTRISFCKIVSNLFKKDSYFTERFYSEEFAKALSEILINEKFDIIQFEHVYMCIYMDLVRKLSSAKITLRPQNLEHIIWQRYMQGMHNPFKKFFINYSAERLALFEKHVALNVDMIFPLTHEDAVTFRNFAPGTPTEVIPMGYDHKKLDCYNYDRQYENAVSFYHLASMDWLPNEEAVRWFMDHVSLKIIAMHTDIKIYLAGRKMQNKFLNKTGTNIIITGEVGDPLVWQENKTVMIVPLLSGSGIRAKIIEGLALGKTIISTTVGAQGIAYTENHNLLIADTPEEFAQQMSRCFTDKEFCRRIGENARQLSINHYEYKSCATKMIDCYHQLLTSEIYTHN